MEPVIIVGSGMAGAAAALKLRKAGIAACVLEAQERIGGRAFSRLYAGTDAASLLEFGGSWITPFHERIRALTPEMGLTLRPRAAVTQRLALRNGEVATLSFSSSDERRAHERAVARIAADAMLCKKGHAEDETGQPLLGITYKSYLDRVNPPEATRDILDAWWTVSGSGAHDVNAASEFLSSCVYGGGVAENMIDVWSDTVEPGMGALAQRMLDRSGAKLRLPCTVIAIQHDDEKVSITTHAGEVLRWRVAVRGTRDNRSLISRRARPSAKLSRKVPPEYIRATTAAASVSPNSNAADIDRAATMSSPTSPFKRLLTISTRRAARTGMTPAAHATLAKSDLPTTNSPRPDTRPIRAMATNAPFRRS